MKKDLNEEVKKITKLMKIENNLINENNLLLEGERDDLLLKFFNMLFDVSDTNIDNLVILPYQCFPSEKTWLHT